MRRLTTLALVATLVALAACRGSEPDPANRAGATEPSAAPSPGIDPTGPTAPAATGPTATGPTATGPTATGPTATGSTGNTGVTERTRFAGRASEIPAALAAEMRGKTWRPGCPVPIEDLALLRFNYWGLDGDIKRGPMVVNEAVAEDVLWVFGRLFDAGFAMKRVGLARAFHEKRYEEQPHSRRDVTASFNCRVVITPAGPQETYSQHSYGLAVDVNPMRNPYVREDGWVRNRYARPYVDRSLDEPGMIHPGDVVVSSFAAIGWTWGGDWSGAKDYMHFSASGS